MVFVRYSDSYTTIYGRQLLVSESFTVVPRGTNWKLLRSNYLGGWGLLAREVLSIVVVSFTSPSPER